MSEEEQLPLRESEVAEVRATRIWQMRCLHFETTCIFVVSIIAFSGGMYANTEMKIKAENIWNVLGVKLAFDLLLLCALYCCRLPTLILWAYHAAIFFAVAGLCRGGRKTAGVDVLYAICGVIAIAFNFECKCGNKLTYRKKYWIQNISTWVIQITGTVLLYSLLGGLFSSMNLGMPTFMALLLCFAVEYAVMTCKKLWIRHSWKTRVKQAEIAWVACSALRSWAAHAQKRLIRRQELQRTDFFLESDINDVWCKPRRFVVSHAWLSKPHPDPDGVHLHELVAELDQLHAKDTDVVFFDYCSLYQTDLCHPDAIALRDGQRLPAGHPALRTREQNEKFERAMQMMHELYTFEDSEVVVLPSVPDAAANNTPYFARGWCFFEFAISTDHWRVINDENCAVSELLTSTHAPLDDSEFIEAFGKKSFTCKGDAKTV